MNESSIEPTHTVASHDTAVSQPKMQEDQLTILFNQGWEHLINQEWQQAEEIFAQIESHNSHFEQEGLHASYLREKAKLEREAEAAWEAGDLKEALITFKQADDFEHVKELYELLTIQELEAKAEKYFAVANYQEAAWIFDHLLTEFPEHLKETSWQIKKESCWEAELLPYFQIGVQALAEEKWRTAYNAFAQVLIVDPYFRHSDHSASALAEIARKEVVLWADQQLRRGQVQEALDAYREVGHLARIENVDEFLRLRQSEEESARQLEANGQWHSAAAKYKYLRTLYYDEDGRNQWQAAANRCLEEGQLSSLHDRAVAAFNDSRWQEAEQLFGQIVSIRPNYQQGDRSARQLCRSARWRHFLSRFSSHSSNPPQIQTGKLS